jgi:hypothetical protein
MEEYINIIFLIAGLIYLVVSAVRKNNKKQPSIMDILDENDPIAALFDDKEEETQQQYQFDENNYENASALIDEKVTNYEPVTYQAVNDKPFSQYYTPVNLEHTHQNETTIDKDIEFEPDIIDNKPESIIKENFWNFNARDAILYSEILKPKFF